MRHNQNRRSRGRNRKGPNPLTRSYESNGPDVKVRGTAAHVAERYMTLARDAQSSGDSVAAENYLQHAEHYIRIVMAAQAQFQPMQPNQFREGQDELDDDDRQMNGRIRDRFDSNGRDGRAPDDDLEAEDGDDEEERGFPPRGDDRPMQSRHDNRGPGGQDNRGPSGQDDRGPRQDRQFRQDDRGYRGDDRGQRDDRGPRQDRGPDNRNYDNRGPKRFERRDRPERFEAPRFDRANGPQDRAEETHASAEVNGAVEALPLVEAAGPEPTAAVAPVPMPDEAPSAPRKRRGRPPRAVNGADDPDNAADATPDGAAALAAFPE